VYPPTIRLVAKTDLPRQACQESLDYNRLISTLVMVDGEPVAHDFRRQRLLHHLHLDALYGDPGAKRRFNLSIDARSAISDRIGAEFPMRRRSRQFWKQHRESPRRRPNNKTLQNAAPEIVGRLLGWWLFLVAFGLLGAALALTVMPVYYLPAYVVGPALQVAVDARYVQRAFRAWRHGRKSLSADG
jgi:hypothetical protein